MICQNNETIDIKAGLINVVDDCISQNVLGDFLSKNKDEVLNILLDEWTIETALENSFKEGIELGLTKGEEVAIMIAARVMKEKGMDVGTIAEVTNLPIDTVLNL